AEQRHPKAQGVEAREGHVPRPDHQRDEVVGHPDQDRHPHEEDHGGAVHREELVEGVRRQEVEARAQELPADQEGLDPADDQEETAPPRVEVAPSLPAAPPPPPRPPPPPPPPPLPALAR